MMRKLAVVAALAGLMVLLAPEPSAATAKPIELPPQPKQAPPGLFITVYDWSLGGVNCDGDCGHTALTTTGPELYGWTAACPVAWLGHITTTVITIWGQSFWCIDAFGDEVNQRLTTVDGRRVYRIDIAYRPATAHPWNQEYVPFGQWSKKWRPMWEFAELRRPMPMAEPEFRMEEPAHTD